MPSPTLASKRTPLDDITADAIQEFATFVRRVAPRWVTGSRSLSQLSARRAHQRELARGHRRGFRLVNVPARPVPSSRVVGRCKP